MKFEWKLIQGEIPYFLISTSLPIEGYFSTRYGIGFLDSPRIVFLKQVHSEKVHYVRDEEEILEGDALITDYPGLFLGIKVADCYPIYLIDPETPSIGLIHAGWRGSLKGIQKNTVYKMKEIFGTEPSKLIVFFGPGISKNYYEVGKEVATLFRGYVETKGNRFFLDLYSFNRDQLVNIGISPLNIIDPPACTYDRPDLFFSYRRDGKILGKMWALLRIQDTKTFI